MRKDAKARLLRFETTIASFLFQAAADGTLRQRLVEGVREAREAMSDDDRAKFDAQVERTIAAHGVERRRKPQ